MCGDCHTPRNDKGEPIPGKTLQGAVLGIKPIAPMRVWADKTPNIAGLPGCNRRTGRQIPDDGSCLNGLPAQPADAAVPNEPAGCRSGRSLFEDARFHR